jgi:hypothetical protein
MPVRVATVGELSNYHANLRSIISGNEANCLLFTPVRPIPNNEEVTVFVGPNVSTLMQHIYQIFRYRLQKGP